MIKTNIASTAVAAALCAAFAMPASAEILNYSADLTADAVVPPIESTASGTAAVVVDTDAKTVSWMVTVDGLSGEPTAAHIHGPAAEGENAGPVITMEDTILEGEAEITEDQIKELQDGKYYVNVHTEANPDGEIRGQLTKDE